MKRRLKRRHGFAAVGLLLVLATTLGASRARLANLAHGGSDIPHVAGASSQPVRMTIAFGGRTRQYWLYRPQSVTGHSRVPLVLNLPTHGFPTAELPDYELLADREGLLFAFPVTETEWRDPTDQAFVGSVIDDLVAKGGADPTRVYLIGPSGEGVEAYKIACGPTGAKLAGVGGIYAGIITPTAGETGIESVCSPPHPLTIGEVHGTADSFVPYNGRPCQVSKDSGKTGCLPSQLELMQFWARVDGCGPTPSSSTQGILRVDVWQSCRAGTAVELNSVAGADHNLEAVTVGGVSPIVRLWSFFSAHGASTNTLHGKIVTSRVVGTGNHRTLVVVVDISAPATARVTLARGRLTVASGTVKRGAGKATLRLPIRAGARSASYVLSVNLRGAQGQRLVLRRSVNVPK